MKKFFSLFVLLMVFVGASADSHLGTNDCFYASVTSFSQGGLAGGEATVLIDKNFKITITLPEEDFCTLYAAKVSGTIEMQNISGLVDEFTSYTKTLSSGSAEQRELIDMIPYCYNFTGTKTTTIKIGNTSSAITVECVATKDGNVITVQPKDADNVAKAQSGWKELVKYVTSSNVEKGGKFMVTAGSWVINGKEKLDVNEDCSFDYDNNNGYRDALQTYKDNTTLTTDGTATDVEAFLQSGSYLQVGTKKFTLKEGYALHATVDNAEHTIPMSNLFKDFSDNTTKWLAESDDQAKQDIAAYALDLLKAFDYHMRDHNALTVTFWYDTPDAINQANAATSENTAIYTVDGCRVSNMQQPGLYIVNGKKVVK